MSTKIRFSLLWILPVVPLAGLLWLLFYAHVASVQVGHWPMYGWPDPTDIRPWIAGYVLMGVLNALIVATVVAAPALLWISVRGVLTCDAESGGKLRQLAVSAGLVSVFVAGAFLFAAELHGLRAWLLD